MPVSITFSADTSAELHSSIAAFVVASGTTVAAATPTKEQKPAKVKDEPAAPVKEAEPAAEEPNLIDEPEVSIVEVKAAATAYQQKNGRDALAAALKKFGATAGVSTIPADQFAAFVAHCHGD